MPDQTALIIGASRGLGLGLAREYVSRGWRVVATQRSHSDGLAELAAGAGDRVQLEPVDILDEAATATLRDKLDGQRFDVVFVNVGVSLDPEQRIEATSTDEFNWQMTSNALAPMRVLTAFIDLLAPGGVAAVMSSILGSVGANTSGRWEPYRASKAALNTLLRSYAVRAPHANLIAMAPGWVRTDMGGPEASLDIDTSVRGMVDVLASRVGQTGLVYLDYQGKTLPW